MSPPLCWSSPGELCVVTEYCPDTEALEELPVSFFVTEPGTLPTGAAFSFRGFFGPTAPSLVATFDFFLAFVVLFSYIISYNIIVLLLGM